MLLPGSTPGRRTCPRERKSSPPATAHSRAADCNGSAPPDPTVSAGLLICPCASSSGASLLQDEACLPVTLESPLHHLARPGLHSTILASEQCRKTLAIKAHVCGAIGAPAWTPASTQSPIRAVATPPDDRPNRPRSDSHSSTSPGACASTLERSGPPCWRVPNHSLQPANREFLHVLAKPVQSRLRRTVNSDDTK